MPLVARRKLGTLTCFLPLLTTCSPNSLAPENLPAAVGPGSVDAGGFGVLLPDAGTGWFVPSGGDAGLLPCSSPVQCLYVDDAGGETVAPCLACPSAELCEYFATSEEHSGVYPGACRAVPDGCTLGDICDCAPYFTSQAPPATGLVGFDAGSLGDLVCYRCAETLPYGDAGPPTVYCTLALP